MSDKWTSIETLPIFGDVSGVNPANTAENFVLCPPDLLLHSPPYWYDLFKGPWKIKEKDRSC